jgi:hypothetical protein
MGFGNLNKVHAITLINCCSYMFPLDNM